MKRFRITPYQWNNWRTVAIVLGEGYHYLLCSILIGLGLVMLAPGDTFASSHAWDTHAAAATETTWGYRYTLTGIFGLSAIISNKIGWRMVTLWVVTTAHGATAAMIFYSSPPSTGTVVYGLVAMFGYFLMWLMAWDYKQGYMLKKLARQHAAREHA